MIHPISLHSLEFHRVAVGFLSSAGVPQTAWEPVGVPFIPPEVVNGTFYLFRSEDDARAGRNPGGSGFIVRYDGAPLPGRFLMARGSDHFYGVTNWHVALDQGFSVIRLNQKDGASDIIDFGPEHWHFIPGKYDVAAVPLSIDQSRHEVSFVSTLQFCGEPDYRLGYKIGVGDDVFMIGLFIDHSGLSTNVPSARFGNISMLPNPEAMIRQPTGYDGVSYVVDMHSRSGFSGSPVYVYRTFGSDLTNNFFGEEVEVTDIRNPLSSTPRGRVRVRTLFKLLGIHWAQFPERLDFKTRRKLKEVVDPGASDLYIEGMSGMTCVIPGWQIVEVLEVPALKALRDASERDSMAPKPESAV